MERPLIIGIGEVLWDILPHSQQLGGAPINFSYHVNALGGVGFPISTVGEDQLGEGAINELTKRGVTTNGIAVTSEYATGYVQAELDGRGVATYRFPDNIAWDHLVINEPARQAAKACTALCFGSLAQRSPDSRRSIISFIDQLAENVLRIFDLNIRQHFYTQPVIEDSLQRADILKLNDEELPVLAQIYDLNGTVNEQLGALKDRFSLKMIIYTRGGSGSVLFSDQGQVDHPGTPTTVADTIGAGDAFTAAVTLGILTGLPLAEINEHASRVAAYVCSQTGAMPILPESLRLI